MSRRAKNPEAAKAQKPGLTPARGQLHRLVRCAHEKPESSEPVLVFLGVLNDWDIGNYCKRGGWKARTTGKNFPVQFWVNLPLPYDIPLLSRRLPTISQLARARRELMETFDGRSIFLPSARCRRACLLHEKELMDVNGRRVAALPRVPRGFAPERSLARAA